MSDDAMNNAMGMVGTGIGLGIMGLGAGALIRSIGSAGKEINGYTPKKRKSAKKKRSAKKK